MALFHFQEALRFPPVSEIAIPVAAVIPKCIFCPYSTSILPPVPLDAAGSSAEKWAEAGWVLQSCLVKALIVMEKGGGVVQCNAEKRGWLRLVQEK